MNLFLTLAFLALLAIVVSGSIAVTRRLLGWVDRTPQVSLATLASGLAFVPISSFTTMVLHGFVASCRILASPEIGQVQENRIFEETLAAIFLPGFLTILFALLGWEAVVLVKRWRRNKVLRPSE